MSEKKPRMLKMLVPGWLTFYDGDTNVSMKIDAIESILTSKGLYWNDETESPITIKKLENKWYSLFSMRPQIKETTIHYALESCIKPYVKIMMASGKNHEIKMNRSNFARDLHEELLDWIEEWRIDNKYQR